jgi:peptide deformylase
MKKEIVTNLTLLRKPCEPITKEDNLKPIIQDLKDSLDPTKGYALSSNQISYNKRIFFVKFPKIDPKTKQISYEEMIVINPKIVEKLGSEAGRMSFFAGVKS